jgi:hypothetical protein
MIKISCCLPANRVGAIVHSHPRPELWSLIYCEQLSQTAGLAIFKEVMLFLNRFDIQNLKIPFNLPS